MTAATFPTNHIPPFVYLFLTTTYFHLHVAFNINLKGSTFTVGSIRTFSKTARISNAGRKLYVSSIIVFLFNFFRKRTIHLTRDWLTELDSAFSKLQYKETRLVNSNPYLTIVLITIFTVFNVINKTIR